MTTIESASAAQSAPRGIGARVSDAVESTLRRRSTKPGGLARGVEERAKRGGARVWVALKRHPFLGVGTAAVAGVAAASAVGVGEIAIGAALAYAAYNVLVCGEAPSKVVRELAHELEG